ncbi:hypothetical protein KQI72_12475 [Eubacterium sp. MSJ-21]|nr:hypothetical protein [Eubacterium sp. MSJ-21]
MVVRYLPESLMGRKKCGFKLTNAVYSNRCLNRKLMNLGRNIHAVCCILNHLETISACKKLRK